MVWGGNKSVVGHGILENIVTQTALSCCSQFLLFDQILILSEFWGWSCLNRRPEIEAGPGLYAKTLPHHVRGLERLGQARICWPITQNSNLLNLSIVVFE